MMIVNLVSASIYTLLIVLALIGVFLFYRYYTDSRKKKITYRTIVAAYLLMLLLLGGAIMAILYIWNYDISDFILAIWNRAVVVLEDNIPRLVGMLMIIFVGMFIYKIAKVTLRRFEKKTAANQRRRQTISKVTLSIVKYIVVIAGILSVLALWGLNVGPALTGLGIMGLVIGLGAQKFINDLISGFFIIFEHHFDVGDWVQVGDFMGEVIDIGLKTTKIKDFKGEVRIFNNGSIEPVSNFSLNESLAIAQFSIAYKEDVQRTMEVLNKELATFRDENPDVLEIPSILGVDELGDSGVNIRAVVLTKSMTQWRIQRILRQRIKEILDNHEIEIPFHQVTLHQPDKKAGSRQLERNSKDVDTDKKEANVEEDKNKKNGNKKNGNKKNGNKKKDDRIK